MVIALPWGTVLAASVVTTCTMIHKPMTAYAFVCAIVWGSAAPCSARPQLEHPTTDFTWAFAAPWTASSGVMQYSIAGSMCNPLPVSPRVPRLRQC